jgi:cobalt-zinc-cadmium efflux system outer membrane protein
LHATAEAAIGRSESARQALRLFYRALAEHERAAIAAAQVARLDEATRVVSRRQAEGTAAGYEQARLQVEAELARSQQQQAATGADALRAELAALLGGDGEGLQLLGSLATSPPATQVRAPPSLASARAAVRESARARQAAGSAWVPALALSGGLRLEHEEQTRAGYVAGIELDLPLFSGGRAEQSAAHAQALLAAAGSEARSAQQRIEGQSARVLLEGTRQELTRLEAASAQPLQRLAQATESAYREGRLGVVELLDAQRAQGTAALRRLDLALAAKLAEVELRAATGELE